MFSYVPMIEEKCIPHNGLLINYVTRWGVAKW
jgi:hypothetical protein